METRRAKGSRAIADNVPGCGTYSIVMDRQAPIPSRDLRTHVNPDGNGVTLTHSLLVFS